MSDEVLTSRQVADLLGIPVVEAQRLARKSTCRPTGLAADSDIGFVEAEVLVWASANPFIRIAYGDRR